MKKHRWAGPIDRPSPVDWSSPISCRPDRGWAFLFVLPPRERFRRRRVHPNSGATTVDNGSSASILTIARRISASPSPFPSRLRRLRRGRRPGRRGGGSRPLHPHYRPHSAVCAAVGVRVVVAEDLGLSIPFPSRLRCLRRGRRPGRPPSLI
jgi:hypothetical protein